MCKNKANRIMSVLITIAIVFAFLPTGIITVSAATVESGTCGDNLTWNLDSAGNLTISGIGAMTNYNYTSAAPWGRSIKTVKINFGVTSIGDNAFRNCRGLTSVTIPDSVTSIGDYAFGNCTGLTSVTIPDSVTSIHGFAFLDCNKITLCVGSDSYAHQYALKKNLDFIISHGTCGANLTWNLDSAGNLTISGTGVMSNYSSKSQNGTYITTAPWVSRIKTVTIDSGVTSIGMYAFGNCTGLTSVTIPDSVTSIGDRAFLNCIMLTSVTIPNSVTSIGDYAFGNCTGLTSVTIPNSVTSIGDYAFQGCTKLTSVTIGNGVTSIGWAVFNDCTGLTSVAIGDSVKSIGSLAFQNCTKLTSVTIPDSVTSIGYRAFGNCTGLTSVTIPDSVKSIGSLAFNGCGLRRISIPNSVTRIDMGAFGNCTDLARITISGAPVIESNVFTGTSYYNNASNWTRGYFNGYPGVNYEYSVLYIDSCLVDLNCGERVEEIEIPRGTVSIADRAFGGCSNISAVAIPRSVIAIGDNAFVGCSSITLNVTENSYGHRYAKKKGIRYSLNFIMLGDPDDDGEITVADALAALRVAAKLAPVTNEMLDCCDIDGDGQITVADALAILRVAAKLADSL